MQLERSLAELTRQLQVANAELAGCRTEFSAMLRSRDNWKREAELATAYSDSAREEIIRLRTVIHDAERRASLGESHLTAAATLLRNGIKTLDQESEVRMGS